MRGIQQLGTPAAKLAPGERAGTTSAALTSSALVHRFARETVLGEWDTKNHRWPNWGVDDYGVDRWLTSGLQLEALGRASREEAGADHRAVHSFLGDIIREARETIGTESLLSCLRAEGFNQWYGGRGDVGPRRVHSTFWRGLNFELHSFKEPRLDEVTIRRVVAPMKRAGPRRVQAQLRAFRRLDALRQQNRRRHPFSEEEEIAAFNRRFGEHASWDYSSLEGMIRRTIGAKVDHRSEWAPYEILLRRRGLPTDEEFARYLDAVDQHQRNVAGGRAGGQGRGKPSQVQGTVRLTRAERELDALYQRRPELLQPGHDSETVRLLASPERNPFDVSRRTVARYRKKRVRPVGPWGR